MSNKKNNIEVKVSGKDSPISRLLKKGQGKKVIDFLQYSLAGNDTKKAITLVGVTCMIVGALPLEPSKRWDLSHLFEKSQSYALTPPPVKSLSNAVGENRLNDVLAQSDHHKASSPALKQSVYLDSDGEVHYFDFDKYQQDPKLLMSYESPFDLSLGQNKEIDLDYLNKIERFYGMPNNLLKGIVTIESEGKAKAQSGAGAKGYYQFRDPAGLETGLIKVRQKDGDYKVVSGEQLTKAIGRMESGDLTGLLDNRDNWVASADAAARYILNLAIRMDNHPDYRIDFNRGELKSYLQPLRAYNAGYTKVTSRWNEPTRMSKENYDYPLKIMGVASGELYVVQRGDLTHSIAKKLGTTECALRVLNKDFDNESLKAGGLVRRESGGYYNTELIKEGKSFVVAHTTPVKPDHPVFDDELFNAHRPTVKKQVLAALQVVESLEDCNKEKRLTVKR
ncbi:LysM peptidoglycan-binding domain-containing protein [Photobacterium leiognathi]|uniref:LysM peptidoglycan-binding domain-containing protein n=1 Tax=Photobacterium leiognathi TaxID=553611 RepID=UPI002981840F|nr:LysM peptidoglycan-binding domain-containing protein [Photobacterium leiognathi]